MGTLGCLVFVRNFSVLGDLGFGGRRAVRVLLLFW